MMKRILTTAFIFMVAMATMTAQEFTDLDKSPLDMAYYPSRAAFRNFKEDKAARLADEPLIRVLYSRPQKKGRTTFGGELAKYGEVWRAGANESAEIMFLKDVTLGDQRVKAGRYTFYIKPSKENWEVHFNTDLDGWGAYAFNPAHNVAVVTASVEKSEKSIEAFSVTFEKSDDGAHMIMGWDETVCRVPIKF